MLVGAPNLRHIRFIFSARCPENHILATSWSESEPTDTQISVKIGVVYRSSTTEGRPIALSPALNGAVDSCRLDAAWAFPGARRRDSGSALKVAAVIALLFHAALSLVRTQEPLPAPSASVAQLETLIPIDALPSPPEPEADRPQPEEKQEESVRQRAPRASTTARSSSSASSHGGDPQSEEATPGASSEELAAPLTTSDFGSANFAMLSGQGSSLGSGGLGRPGRGSGARPTSTTVSARDLSRSASPPHLDSLVQRNFPAAAKIARVGGTVTVSALIQADGTPTDIRVISVSPSGRGFGETCSRTVHEGPNWRPQLNQHGTPVASRERYTCHFRPPEGAPADVDGPTSGVGANRIWTKPAGG